MTRSALAPGLSSDMPAIDRSLAGGLQDDDLPAASLRHTGNVTLVIPFGSCVCVNTAVLDMLCPYIRDESPS